MDQILIIDKQNPDALFIKYLSSIGKKDYTQAKIDQQILTMCLLD